MMPDAVLGKTLDNTMSSTFGNACSIFMTLGTSY